jgi:hypothetical protein
MINQKILADLIIRKGARVKDMAVLFSSSAKAGLLKKDIFCFKRIRISNKPNSNTGIENNRNIGGMSYEDQ